VNKLGQPLGYYGKVFYDSTNVDRIFAISPILGCIQDHRYGIYRSDDGGDSFYFLLENSAHVLGVSTENPDTIYASGKFGLIVKSTDGGGQWLSVGHNYELIKPHFPFEPLPLAAVAGIDACSGIAVSPRDANEVFIAFLGKGIARSRDGGKNWCIMDLCVEDAYTTNSIFYDPIVDSVIYVGTDDHGMFRSQDVGTVWERIDIAARLRK
jgi:photosystem II stability/assembly factor-like uncharacterized protein